jgi:hypothetical protein
LQQEKVLLLFLLQSGMHMHTVHSHCSLSQNSQKHIPLLRSFRKGWERQQVSLQPAPAVAGLALPATLAFRFYVALPGAAVRVLRQLLFCFLSFVLILRPASMLSVQWMRVHDGMLQYKPLHWKGHVVPADKAPVLQFPVAHLPFVSSALEKLLSSRYGAASM